MNANTLPQSLWLKAFLILSLLILLSSCGGGSSTSKTDSKTLRELAFDVITAYAENNEKKAPTLQDYMNAGVSGVSTKNLAELNKVVAGLSKQDVDTKEELEALTAKLGINIAPVANAGKDQTVEVNKTITITGSGTDADGSIASYQWKKGNKVLSTKASFEYTPTVVGTDVLTLLVVDNNGETTVDKMSVVVTKASATTVATLPAPTVTPNNPPVITVLGDNPVNIFKGGRYIDAGGTAKDSENGSINIVTTGLESIKTDSTGTYKIVYTATDRNGNKTTKERLVNIIEGKKRGQFVDSAVEGLSYRIGNTLGTTDKDGYFNYDETDDDIYFSIGKLNIGLARTSAYIHINDLEGGIDSVINAKNIKIAQLLLSLDTDRNPDNNIQLPADINEKFNGSFDFDFSLSQEKFDENLKIKLAEWGVDNFVAAGLAESHVKQSGIELAKLCSLSNPINPYENKEIKDLSCVDKSRLNYFYKRIAPLLHSNMNAKYAQTVIVEESYNQEAAKKAIQSSSILSSLETIDARIGVIEAKAKGDTFAALGKQAQLLSKMIQTFVNSSFVFKENSSDNKSAANRYAKQASVVSELLNAVFNIPSCVSIIRDGKKDDGACFEVILSTLNASKENLELSNLLLPQDTKTLEGNINILINSLKTIKSGLDLIKAKNPKEVKRALFGLAGSLLDMSRDAVLASYRSADGKDPTPQWEAGYISLRVIDAMAKPLINIGEQCFSGGSDDPYQMEKCYSKITQEIGKRGLETTIAVIGVYQIISTVKDLNAQIVASRVLEEFLFSGSANHKEVYEKYGVSYGETKAEQHIMFGQLIKAIGEKYHYNGIGYFEAYTLPIWKLANNPFSVPDVRSIVSNNYTRIINEASVDFESPAISIDVVKTNIVGQRRALITINSSEYYGATNTKLVCSSDYNSTYPNTSPWTGSFKDTHSFFVEENTAAFDIEFTTTGRRALSCNLYKASGEYLGSQSIVFGVLKLEAGADKTIIEGQAVQLDVPKLESSDLHIIRYRYAPYNTQDVYCDTSDTTNCVVEGLTEGTHEVFVLVDTENEIRETAVVKVTVFPADTDTDSDLMPDLWELQYTYDSNNPDKPYLDPEKNDANADADGDGVSNYQEYIDETDPTDPSSVKISSLAPSNVEVLSDSEGNLIVQWDAVENASIYTICMATESIDSISQCTDYAGGRVIGTVTNEKIISTGVEKNIEYYFRVRAVDRQGHKGVQSEEVNIKLLPTSLLAPSNVEVLSDSEGNLIVQWDAVENASIYTICMATESIDSISQCTDYAGGRVIGSVTNEKTISTGVEKNIKYYLRVRAVDRQGHKGVQSEEVNIKLLPTSLTAPANFTATAGDKKVTLSWSAVDNVAYYNVCRALEPITDINNCDAFQDGTWSGGVYNKTTLEIGNLSNGTKYYFRVVAADSNDNYSPASEQISATPAGSSNVDLTNGLVAYYAFEDNANDSTSNNNHGVKSGGVSYSSGKHGKAAKFGGINNPGHIRISNSSSLQFTGGATYSGWVKVTEMIHMDGWGRTQTTGGGGTFFAKSHDRVGAAFRYYVNRENEGSGGIRTYDYWAQNGWGDKKYTFSNSLNEWAYITLTLSKSGGANIYFNGNLWRSSTTGVSFDQMNNRDLYIGKYSDSWYPFIGLIDDFSVYNRVLNSVEVGDLYQKNDGVPSVAETGKVLFEGDNYSPQVNSDSHILKDGKHYLVWSNGVYSTSSLYNTFDNKIKVSASTDGVNWSTEDIFTTAYGSYNHKIAIDSNGKLHIVYTETVGTGTYGYSNRNLVYITNINGDFEKVILETGSSYSFHQASKLFFTNNGVLNLFYQKSGWWRYNAPLYERNLIDGQWSNKKLISNLSYGRGDPDDDENILLAYDISSGKKVLYISSGYWHLQYHGDVKYSGHIFKLTENGNGYDKEEISYSGSFFDRKNGDIVYANTDRNKLFLNGNEIFSLGNNEKIYTVMFDGIDVAINTRTKNSDSSYQYYAYKLSKTGSLNKKYDDGYFVLTDSILIFVQYHVNPKKIIIE